MPNAPVTRYRSAFPNDNRSDEELTLILGDIGRARGDTTLEQDPEFRQQYLDLKQVGAPSLPAEFAGAIRSGTNLVQAQLYDTMRLAGAVPMPVDLLTGGAIGRKLREVGQEGYERNLQEAAETRPTIEDVRDVRDTGEAVRYGLGLIGTQAPQMAGTLGAGAAGFLVGGPPGAVAGATAFGFTQNQIYGELRKNVEDSEAVPIALGVGGVNALLDAIVPLKIGSTLLRGASAKVAKEYYKRVLTHVPINAFTEATTETLQEVTAIAGELFANRNNKDFDITPEEIKRRVINSAAAGFLLGGVTGPVEALARPAEAEAAPQPPVLTRDRRGPVPPRLEEILKSPAAASGYFDVTQETVDQLAGLAIRELEGTLPQLEKDALLKTAELRSAYEVVRDNIVAQLEEQGEPGYAIEEGKVEEGGTGKRPGTAPILPGDRQDRPRETTVIQTRKVDSGGSRIVPFQEPEADPVSTPWLFAIAEDFVARVGGILNPSTANRQRLGIVKAIISNPTKASANNLAALFGLKVDDRATGLPARFSFVPVPADIPSLRKFNVALGGPKVQAIPATLVSRVPPAAPLPEGAPFHEQGDYPAALPILTLPEGEAIFSDVPPFLPGESTPTPDPDSTITQELRGRAIEAVLDRKVRGARKAKAKVAVVKAPAAPVKAPAAPAKVPVTSLVPAATTPTTPKATAAAPPVLAPFDVDGLVNQIDWAGTFDKAGKPFLERLPALALGVRKRLERILTKGARDSEVQYETRTSSDGRKRKVKITKKANITRRVTFFRNTATNEVLGLGTYTWGSVSKAKDKASRKDQAYLTNPDPEKAKRGVTLSEMLAKRHPINFTQPLWEPVASVRLTEEHSADSMRFLLTPDEWATFLNAARVRDAFETTAKAKAMSTEERMRKLADINAKEDEDPNPKPPVLAGPKSFETGLNTDQVKVLWEVVGGKEQSLEFIIIGAEKIVRPIATAHRGGFRGMMRDLETALDATTFEDFYAAFDPGGFELYKKSAPGPAQSGTGFGGRVVVDRGIHFTVSTGTQGTNSAFPILSSAEVRARFNQVIQRLRDFGVPVQLFQALVSETGQYREAARLVTLSLFDMANPTVENLRMLLHESAHALFATMPKEMQDRIRNSIDQASDEALGITATTDPRINKGNPAGLPLDILAEERFAEWLTLNGLEAAPARNIAAAIWRLIKDLYYRAALAFQGAFAREVDNDLALAFAANRFGQFIAGDAKVHSIFNYLIPPMPPGVQLPQFTPVYAGDMERVSIDDSRVIEYPMVIPDSFAAYDYNIRWTRPEKFGERQAEVVAETHIAAFNEQLEADAAILARISTIPEVLGAVMESNFSYVRQWFLSALGIQNATALVEDQLKRIDLETQQPVQANRAVRIDDLTSDVNRDRTAMLALGLMNKLVARVGNKMMNAIEEIAAIDTRRTKAAKDLLDSARSYLNIEGLTAILRDRMRFVLRRLFRDLNRDSQSLGVIAQQLRQLDGPNLEVNAYLPIFRRFAASDAMFGKLMNFLDLMANDPGVDLSANITQVRDSLRANPRYEELVQADPESRALLATLMAAARTNKRLVALLNLRRLRDTDTRTRLSGDVDTMLKQGLAVADRIGRLTRTAVLEDRLKRAFLDDKREVDAMFKRQEYLRAVLKAGEVAIAVYSNAANDLAGRLELRTPFTYSDGAIIWVPPSPTATMAEVQSNPITIRLDASMVPIERSTFESYIAAMSEWLLARERSGQKDGFYYTIRGMRDEMVNNGVVTPGAIRTDHRVFDLWLSDPATKAKAFGTPSGRLFAQMVNRFAAVLKSLYPSSIAMGLKTERLLSQAIKILAEGRPLGVSVQNYERYFYTPGVAFLEHRRDILEGPGTMDRKLDVAFREMYVHFTRDPAKVALLAGKEQRFMAALRKHIMANGEAARAYLKHNIGGGIGVRDERFQVYTPSGEKVAAERKATEQGLVTIPVTVSDIFRTMFNAMANANWAALQSQPGTGFGALLERLNKDPNLDLNAINSAVQRYFANEDIQRYFFEAIALVKDTESAFPAPMFEDGETIPEARPEYTAAAYTSSGGNVAAFIQRMYDLHGGSETQTVTQYGMEILQVFLQSFNEARGLMEKVDPEFHDANPQWSTMVPGFMVNSRKIQHHPSIWRKHIMFDRRMNLRVNARVAAQIAFGVDQERLAAAYETMLREADAAVTKLRAAVAKVQNEVVADKPSAIEAALEAEVGGKEDLKRLRKMQQMLGSLSGSQSIRAEMITFFRGMDSPVRPIRLAHQIVILFIRLMINQPGSALGNLADMFTPWLTFGVSAPSIRFTLRNIGTIGVDAITGLVSTFGMQWGLNDRFEQRYFDLGQGDPAPVARAKDLLLKETNLYDGSAHTKLISTMRKIGEAQEFGLGKGKNKRTVLRVLAPFNQFSLMLNRAATINLWKFASDFVLRGAEFYQSSHGMTDGALSEWKSPQWAKALGMGKFEANSFAILYQLMLDEWGLDFFRLIREARVNMMEGKDAMSDRTLLTLQGLAMKEMTHEGGLNTMPLSSSNSTLVKFISPLLGWPFRRAQKVARMWMDPNGKASYAAVANMLLSLVAAGAGGLGVSALVDLYNEEALRKRRNLRRLTLSEDPEQMSLAILEHTARVGTLGLFGDILNEGLNVGTGEGQNRGISLDQRIVFVSSALGILRSISNLANQDFSVDYAGVVRPLVYSVGGNGAMQYMQIANRVFDLDNIEAAATRRTNVGNWLRAVGRQLDYEVEKSKAGYSTPTPLTPFITRMVLASYRNDPSGFNEAYRAAVREARVSKKLDINDAETAVKRAFQSRHPLRSTFRATLTQKDYLRLLSALPDGGREDVSSAIAMFNAYGDRLGLEPFVGKDDDERRGPGIVRLKSQEDFGAEAIRERRQRAMAARY